jgi:hypothetical protein
MPSFTHSQADVLFASLASAQVLIASFQFRWFQTATVRASYGASAYGTNSLFSSF